jgi:hypothetical protein
LVTALTGIAAVRLRALNPNAAEFTFAWCVFSLVVGRFDGIGVALQVREPQQEDEDARWLGGLVESQALRRAEAAARRSGGRGCMRGNASK